MTCQPSRIPAAACVLFATLTFLLLSSARAEPLPEWTARIRRDHPRLFFNTDTWPAVRDRALNQEHAWYESIKARVDRLANELDKVDRPEPQELGPEAAWAAFVFLMTDDVRYRDLAKKCLDTSLRFYDQCFEQKKTVNWYSTSRVHATMAWDWLYNHLTEAERQDLMSRLVTAVDRVIKARPAIYRENISGYNTGFYGAPNCLWFIGCTAFGTGIETERVGEWLVWGHDENLKLLEHRKTACGEDGGGASPTLGYVFGAYPWAEQNYFYTWLSSTGENIAPDWPHSAWLASYVIWNWIDADPVPLEFGYGDTPHTDNRLPIGQLYTHMANIRHLYGQSLPEAAALARHLQEKLPDQSYSRTWFIYPFLLADLEKSPPAADPEDLPNAFHFEPMGQVFMRSGSRARRHLLPVHLRRNSQPAPPLRRPELRHLPPRPPGARFGHPLPGVRQRPAPGQLLCPDRGPQLRGDPPARRTAGALLGRNGRRQPRRAAQAARVRCSRRSK